MKKFFKKVAENVRANMQDTLTRNVTVIGLGFTACCAIMCIAATFLK